MSLRIEAVDDGSRSVALPVPLSLTLIVAIAAGTHFVLASDSPTPWVMPDELRYSEMAKSIAAGGLPRIRDEITFAFGFGYPLLIAPAWLLFENVSHAYLLAKAINALVLAATAIPSYFLATQFVTRSAALVVAGLSVSVPSLLYAGTLMTEVLLYPLVVTGLLSMAVALRRPSVRSHMVVLVTITVAALVKIAALALFLSFVVAALLWVLVRSRVPTRSLREEIQPFSTWFTVAAAISLTALAALLAVGVHPSALLGAYAEALHGIDVKSVPARLVWHLAELDLYLAVIPLAATSVVVVRGLRRGGSTREQLFAALTIGTCCVLIGVVALYSSNSTPSLFGYATGAGANERSLFFLSPLFFIGLMMWLERRSSLSTPLTLSVLLAALLPALIPLSRFAEPGNVAIQAFSLVPWVGADEHAHWPYGVLVFTLMLSFAFVLSVVGGARDAVVVAPVAAALLVVTAIAQSTLADSSRWAQRVALGTNPRWVDEAVGADARVSVLWHERPGQRFALDPARQRVLWLAEFHNRSIAAVYELGSPMAFGYELPTVPVRLKGHVVVTQRGDAADMGALVLVPCGLAVEGRVIASDAATGALLYRVSGDVTARVVPSSSCPVF